MYHFLRPLIFRLDPEQAHALTIQLLRLAGRAPGVTALLESRFRAPSRPVEAFGLNFKNPVGLAAGYDKDGLGWRGLAALGFGHIEVGTVTPEAQPGNPRPRLFRLPEEDALINRMGFPGRGAAFVARQLRGPRPPGLVLGVNLGKNQSTPLDNAAADYLHLMRVFAPMADYLVVNVSSPNTVGLRRLQVREALHALLAQLKEEQRALEAKNSDRLPVLVKIAPDLSEKELEDALEVMLEVEMAGVIAANTTVGRDGLTSPRANEEGGLSGEPLRRRSTQMVEHIHCFTGGRLPVIAVGGVMGAADAREKLAAGASLVQVYTGLIYRGPGLVKEILASL
jgi:dihydroorotate dehydrogenase